MEEEVKRELFEQLRRPQLTRDELERLIIALLPVGRVKGRIGKWVVRWQNDKPIISRVPEFFHPSQTPSSVKNRQVMAAVTKFAICLNQIASIKEIWDRSKTSGNCAYRKMISYNKKRFDFNKPSCMNAVTPGSNGLVLQNFSVTETNKTFTISQDAQFAAGDKLALILVPYDPYIKASDEFEVIKIYESSPAQQISITLTIEQMGICANYKRFFLYAALIRKSGDKLSWSETAAAGHDFSRAELSDQAMIYTFLLIPVYSLSETGVFEAAEGEWHIPRRACFGQLNQSYFFLTEAIDESFLQSIIMLYCIVFNYTCFVCTGK